MPNTAFEPLVDATAPQRDAYAGGGCTGCCDWDPGMGTHVCQPCPCWGYCPGGQPPSASTTFEMNITARNSSARAIFIESLLLLTRVSNAEVMSRLPLLPPAMGESERIHQPRPWTCGLECRGFPENGALTATDLSKNWVLAIAHARACCIQSSRPSSLQCHRRCTCPCRF